MICVGAVEETMPSPKLPNYGDAFTTEADPGKEATADHNDLCKKKCDNMAVASYTSMRQVKRKTRSSSSAGLLHAARTQCIAFFFFFWLSVAIEPYN